MILLKLDSTKALVALLVGALIVSLLLGLAVADQAFAGGHWS